jgi:iron-sulfur cluster assembly protein
VISLTDRAIDKINSLKAQPGKQSLGLRIGIMEGGSCDRTFYVGLQNNSSSKDAVFEIKDIKIFIDNSILPLIKEAVLDYIPEPIEGFILDNLKIKRTGNCGNSFCTQHRF